MTPLLRLLQDDRGSATTQLLSLSPLWFIVFGVFLMNVQLGRSYLQRDMVDHATAVAADATMKTLCADARDFGGVPLGAFTGARERAVREAIDPLLELVSSEPRACTLAVHPRGEGGSPGTQAVEVELRCDFPCDIPIAAQAMCSGSPRRVRFAAKRTTVAMGCDVAEGG